MQALTELLIAEYLMAATRIALILIGHQQSKILSEKLVNQIGVTSRENSHPVTPQLGHGCKKRSLGAISRRESRS